MNESLHTRLLQTFATKHQVKVASEAGIDKTAVHRIVSGERGVMLKEIEALLAALGMAVIECEGGLTVTVPVTEYQALKTLARKALEDA